jgi:hypothetical protein
MSALYFLVGEAVKENHLKFGHLKGQGLRILAQKKCPDKYLFGAFCRARKCLALEFNLP